MAIAFGYTEATNIVVVTGGTSDTPADFNDFVTADRAGVDTDLLVAGSPAAALALTYAVRPVEDLAVLVKCIVANKTAEADFIFITGKDWRGAAQTESIDVTAGNASYTSTKYWSEITTLDCSDNAAGGGVVWADGDLSVTQDVWGVIWDYGGWQYKVACDFNIGNASTSTYFTSKSQEMVFFDTNFAFVTTSNATLQLGEKVGDWGTNGVLWSITPGADININNGGILLVYASMLHNRAAFNPKILSGTTTILNSILSQHSRTSWEGRFRFEGGTISLDKTYFNQVESLLLKIVPTLLKDCHVHNANSGVASIGSVNDIIADGVTWSSLIGHDVTAHSYGAEVYDFYVKDPGQHITNPQIHGSETRKIVEQYTCNIHVADKDGGAIPDTATVLCTRATVVTESAKFYKCIIAHTSGTFATDLAAGKWEEITDATILDAAPAWLTGTAFVSAEQEFSVNPTSGVIAEQTIIYKKWTGTSVLETKHIHTFTLSESGYETEINNDIEVDNPIVWRLELQQQKQSPAPWQEGVM